MKSDLECVYALKDRDGNFYDKDRDWKPLTCNTKVWAKIAHLSAFLTSNVSHSYDPADEDFDLGILGEVVNKGGCVVKLKYTESGEIPLVELKCFKNFEDNIVNKKLEDI